MGINNSDSAYCSERLLLGSLGQVAPPLHISASSLVKQINSLARVLRGLINEFLSEPFGDHWVHFFFSTEALTIIPTRNFFIVCLCLYVFLL